MTLIPTTEEEAATIIRDHASKGHALSIVGGNSRAGFGNAVSSHSELTSRGMTGIVAYNPGEMVMTARAGTPVEEIEAALAASHQMMAFEPMNHSPLMATSGVPTIGGIFAANASGPRRILAGAARDSLLGVRFVNGRGEIVKAGGRVMKNVTGLDLPKLMAGSHGTLGLLTEVTFRVPPSPKTEQTLVISDLTDEAATKAMAAAMALSVEVSGAAHLPVTVASTFAPAAWSAHSAMVLRIEGLAASVDVRMEKLSRAMAGIGPVGQLPDAESKAVWRAIRDVVPFADGTMRPVWRVSVAPAPAIGWSPPLGRRPESMPSTTGRAALYGCGWKPSRMAPCCAVTSPMPAAVTRHCCAPRRTPARKTTPSSRNSQRWRFSRRVSNRNSIRQAYSIQGRWDER